MNAESWANERPPHSFEKPNYTQTPNDLFSMMPTMGNAELRVVMAIIRETLGYHQASKKISITRLSLLTGLSQQGVMDGAADAEERGLIVRVQNGKRTTLWALIAPWLDSPPEMVRPCSICGNLSPETHSHHIIPKEFGGENRKDNLAVLCVDCHQIVHLKIDQHIIMGASPEPPMFLLCMEETRKERSMQASSIDSDTGSMQASSIDYASQLHRTIQASRPQVGDKERKKESKKGSVPKRQVLENGFYEEWKEFADWFIGRSGMKPITKNDFRDWAVAFGEWKAKGIRIEDLENAWVKAHSKHGFTVVDPRSLTKVAAALAGGRQVYEQNASRVGDIVGARRIINPIVDREKKEAGS